MQSVSINSVNNVNSVNSASHVNILNHANSVNHVNSESHVNSVNSVTSLHHIVASIPDGIFTRLWLSANVKILILFFIETRSCAALQAADLGLSGQDAFVTHKQTEVAHFCDSHRTPADRLK